VRAAVRASVGPARTCVDRGVRFVLAFVDRFPHGESVCGDRTVGGSSGLQQRRGGDELGRAERSFRTLRGNTRRCLEHVHELGRSVVAGANAVSGRAIRLGGSVGFRGRVYGLCGPTLVGRGFAKADRLAAPVAADGVGGLNRIGDHRGRD